MSAKIHNCEMCGSVAEIDDMSWRDNAWITCRNIECGLSGPARKTTSEAIIAWNFIQDAIKKHKEAK